MATDDELNTEDRDSDVEEARIAYEKVLLDAARAALEKGEFAKLERIKVNLGLPVAANDENGDMLTQHEKALDFWRLGTTVLLILFLFAAIMYTVKEKSTTAAPYLSLLSGLTGIAIGWMFTGTSGQSADRFREVNHRQRFQKKGTGQS